METCSDLWRRLEAEGRLKEQAWVPYFDQFGATSDSYYSLRLTEEEREKLLWDPAHRALVYPEPEQSEDCGVAEFTNLDILGEE